MMIYYCQCEKPKKKTDSAGGNEYVVCALSLGGCGKEYKEEHRRKSWNYFESTNGVNYVDTFIGVDFADKSDDFADFDINGDVFNFKKHPQYFISRKLAEFLNKKGVLDKFVSNFEKNSLYKNIHHTRVTIATAFNWFTAPEGIDFWDDLSTEYNQLN